MEIAQAFSDKQLQEIFRKHPARSHAFFRGRYYTFEEGNLNLKGAGNKIHTGIAETEKKYGQAAEVLLKLMAQSGGNFGSKEQKEAAKLKMDVYAVLEKLERLKVVAPSYVGEEYREWKMLEETMPLVREELGISMPERKLPAATAGSASQTTVTAHGSTQKDEAPPDPLEDERRMLATMQNELDQYLNDLLKNRLDQTVKFGKPFSQDTLPTTCKACSARCCSSTAS